MSFRDHFSGHADVYAQFRPSYPQELFQYLAAQCRNRRFVWDCATGNGQAAKALAKHFDSVYATDASTAQIDNAGAVQGVRYRVAEAAASGLEDAYADLVTVAQAVHWFDFPDFFAEVDRVLKPGGVLAIWGYGLAMCGGPLDEVVQNFYEAEVGSFWPPERHHVETAYRGIPFPYERQVDPGFFMVSRRNADQLCGYLRTWSATKRYEAERGFDPVSLIESQIRQLWPEDQPVLEFRSNIFLLIGQKP